MGAEYSFKLCSSPRVAGSRISAPETEGGNDLEDVDSLSTAEISIKIPEVRTLEPSAHHEYASTGNNTNLFKQEAPEWRQPTNPIKVGHSQNAPIDLTGDDAHTANKDVPPISVADLNDDMTVDETAKIRAGVYASEKGRNEVDDLELGEVNSEGQMVVVEVCQKFVSAPEEDTIIVDAPDVATKALSKEKDPYQEQHAQAITDPEDNACSIGSPDCCNEMANESIPGDTSITTNLQITEKCESDVDLASRDTFGEGKIVPQTTQYPGHDLSKVDDGALYQMLMQVATSSNDHDITHTEPTANIGIVSLPESEKYLAKEDMRPMLSQRLTQHMDDLCDQDSQAAHKAIQKEGSERRQALLEVRTKMVTKDPTTSHNNKERPKTSNMSRPFRTQKQITNDSATPQTCFPAHANLAKNMKPKMLSMTEEEKIRCARKMDVEGKKAEREMIAQQTAMQKTFELKQMAEEKKRCEVREKRRIAALLERKRFNEQWRIDQAKERVCSQTDNIVDHTLDKSSKRSRDSKQRGKGLAAEIIHTQKERERERRATRSRRETNEGTAKSMGLVIAVGSNSPAQEQHGHAIPENGDQKIAMQGEQKESTLPDPESVPQHSVAVQGPTLVPENRPVSVEETLEEKNRDMVDQGSIGPSDAHDEVSASLTIAQPEKQHSLVERQGQCADHEHLPSIVMETIQMDVDEVQSSRSSVDEATDTAVLAPSTQETQILGTWSQVVPEGSKHLVSPVPLGITEDNLVKSLKDQESRKRHTETLSLEGEQSLRPPYKKVRKEALGAQSGLYGTSTVGRIDGYFKPHLAPSNNRHPEATSQHRRQRRTTPEFEKSKRESRLKYSDKKRAAQGRQSICQEKPFACDTCGRRYEDSSVLVEHSMRCFVADLPKPYPCDVCGNSYGTSGGLKYHKTSGTCATVGSSFSDSPNYGSDMSAPVSHGSQLNNNLVSSYLSTTHLGTSQDETLRGFAALTSPSPRPRSSMPNAHVPLSKRDRTKELARAKEKRDRQRGPKRRAGQTPRESHSKPRKSFVTTTSGDGEEIYFDSLGSTENSDSSKKKLGRDRHKEASQVSAKADKYKEVKAALGRFKDQASRKLDENCTRYDQDTKGSEQIDILSPPPYESSISSDEDADEKQAEQHRNVKQPPIVPSTSTMAEPRMEEQTSPHSTFARKRLPGEPVAADHQTHSQNAEDLEMEAGSFETEVEEEQESEDSKETYWSYHITRKQWQMDDIEDEAVETKCASYYTVGEANEQAQQRSMKLLQDLAKSTGVTIAITLGPHLMQTWQVTSNKIFVQHIVSRSIRPAERLPKSVTDTFRNPTRVFTVFERTVSASIVQEACGTPSSSLQPRRGSDSNTPIRNPEDDLAATASISQHWIGSFYTLDLANRAAGKAWFAIETADLGQSEFDNLRRAERGMYLRKDLACLEERDELFDRYVVRAEGKRGARVWVEVHEVEGPRN